MPSPAFGETRTKWVLRGTSRGLTCTAYGYIGDIDISYSSTLGCDVAISRKRHRNKVAFQRIATAKQNQFCFAMIIGKATNRKVLQSPYYKHSNVLSFLLCSFSVTRYFQRRLPVFQLTTFLQVVMCIGFVGLWITVDNHCLSHNMYLSNMWNINILCYYRDSPCGQTLWKSRFYPERKICLVDNSATAYKNIRKRRVVKKVWPMSRQRKFRRKLLDFPYIILYME